MKAFRNHRLALALLGAALWTGGRWLAQPASQAAPPQQAPTAKTVTTAQAAQTLPLAPETGSEYSRRPVAKIFESVLITREDLGEYLIARQGAEKLELFVNKRIIEHVCQQQGIEVTAAEVEADFQETIKTINIDRNTFVNDVLKKKGFSSVYEWKEDVVRPRILMSKLVRSRVQATEEDLQNAFVSHFGEQIHCRIILIPKQEGKYAFTLWDKVRNNPDEFDKESKKQANQYLAATGGLIKPIGRHSSNDEVEKEAFSLQEGEVGRLIEGPEGILIIKCIKRQPADTTKKFETERAALEKEVLDKKIAKEIPEVFKELHKEANPRTFLSKPTTEEALIRSTKELLQDKDQVKKPAAGLKPVGN